MLPPPILYYPEAATPLIDPSVGPAGPVVTFVPAPSAPDAELLLNISTEEALEAVKRDGEGLNTLEAMRSISMRFLKHSIALRKAAGGETKDSLTAAALAASQMAKHAHFEHSQRTDLNVRADGDTVYEEQLRKMYDLTVNGDPRVLPPQQSTVQDQ